MNRSLSARERRLVAVLLLVAVLALLGRGLVLPVLDGFQERALARADLADRYVRNARLIAGAPRLARLAERQNRELAAFIMVAPTPALAGERLQDRLQALVEATGGEFRLAEIQGSDPDRIAARVEARLTQAQLTQCLLALQNSRPLLGIAAVSINAPDALTASTPGPMDVRIDVTIPYRPGA